MKIKFNDFSIYKDWDSVCCPKCGVSLILTRELIRGYFFTFRCSICTTIYSVKYIDNSEKNPELLISREIEIQ